MHFPDFAKLPIGVGFSGSSSVFDRALVCCSEGDEALREIPAKDVTGRRLLSGPR